MGELDPIVARVLLKGDDEFLSSIKKVGEDGAEAIHKIYEQMSQAGPVGTLLSALNSVEAAISGVAAATILFIEQQTELSQKTTLLADALGVTTGQLQTLEAVFASSGVKVEQFERFANRLTITIAREWPAISESIKTYADQNDAAQLRVQNAALRVHDAQNQLFDGAAERASKAAHNNEAIEASYIKLQFSAQEAAAAQVNALQSVQGAVLGATAARQRLAALQGAPPSAAEKEDLQLAQAELAVREADQKVVEAKLKAQEQAAEASLKQRQLSQANADLERKAAKDARDDAEQAVKDHNAVRSAIIEESEAQEKLNNFQLSAAPSIKAALDGVVSGNKAAASAINLTEVSVDNLTKGIIAQAAEAAEGVEPTGYQTLLQLSTTLSKATKEQISDAQRLAIVNRLAATGMTALGGVGAELLNVLEHDNEELKKFSEQAKALDTKEAKKAIEDFRGALAGINLTISILAQRFAIAISPAFTAFLRAIQSSLESNSGVLNTFGQGLAEIARIVGRVAEGIGILIEKMHLFDENVSGLDAVKAAIIGITTYLVASLGPWAAIPLAIAAVIVAIGELRTHWAELQLVLMDNAVVRFWERVLDVIAKTKSLLSGGGWTNPGQAAAAAAKQIEADAAVAAARKEVEANQASDTTTTAKHGTGNTEATSAATEGLKSLASEAHGAAGALASVKASVSRTSESREQSGADFNAPGHAEGGMIHGPGTTTSDSVFARLSRGEFVVKAAAVQNYGAGLFHALNSMSFPGFAAGGMVPSPVRMAGSGSMPATSTLNLSIDGRSFGGLRGPKSTVDDLTSFAISRQTSQAGNKPSWYK